MSDASDLLAAIKLITPLSSKFVGSANALDRVLDRLEIMTKAIEQGLIVNELRRQVSDLQAREAVREQFIAELQKETAAQVIALISDAKVRAGPGVERQQARMSRLLELARKPQPRGGQNA
jgi:hypothetical protein